MWRLPLGHLRLRHQPAVVVLVPGDRRAPALDRVGEEAGRPVVVDRREGLGHASPRSCRRGSPSAPPAPRRSGASISAVTSPWSPRSSISRRRQTAPPMEGQRRVELVRAGVDPVAAARSPPGSAKAARWSAPYFTRTTSQPKALEDLLDPLPEPLAHHAVERLAVVVDDPPDVAQPVLPALLQAFVDVALVEFRVAHERHHPARRHVAPQSLARDVVLHQRGEGGDRDAEPDRAGGEVDVVDVLGARRIGLRAAVAAEVLQLLARSGCPSDTASRGTPARRAASPRPGPRAAAPRSRAPS